MYYGFAALAAVCVATLVAINGELTFVHGIHMSNLIIHIVGLVIVSFTALLRKERVFKIKGLPIILFLGGLIGYFTTLFNNMAIGRISVTAILALSLLGQAATSLVIDQFGFFDMPVRKFSFSKLMGLAVTCLGIVLLLWGSESSSFIPAFVSLLTGVTVVTSRQINAQLAERTSVLTSTFYNYSVGLITAIVALAIAAMSGAEIVIGVGISKNLWIYLGGAIGVLTVLLSNICVQRMSSLIMTLMMFAGQVFGGVAIDAIFYGEFSLRTLAGGIFAFLGLVVNVWLDGRQDKIEKAGNQ